MEEEEEFGDEVALVEGLLRCTRPWLEEDRPPTLAEIQARRRGGRPVGEAYYRALAAAADAAEKKWTQRRARRAADAAPAPAGAGRDGSAPLHFFGGSDAAESPLSRSSAFEVPRGKAPSFRSPAAGAKRPADAPPAAGSKRKCAEEPPAEKPAAPDGRDAAAAELLPGDGDGEAALSLDAALDLGRRWKHRAEELRALGLLRSVMFYLEACHRALAGGAAAAARAHPLLTSVRNYVVGISTLAASADAHMASALSAAALLLRLWTSVADALRHAPAARGGDDGGAAKWEHAVADCVAAATAAHAGAAPALPPSPLAPLAWLHPAALHIAARRLSDALRDGFAAAAAAATAADGRAAARAPSDDALHALALLEAESADQLARSARRLKDDGLLVRPVAARRVAFRRAAIRWLLMCVAADAATQRSTLSSVADNLRFLATQLRPSDASGDYDADVRCGKVELRSCEFAVRFRLLLLLGDAEVTRVVERVPGLFRDVDAAVALEVEALAILRRDWFLPDLLRRVVLWLVLIDSEN